MRMNYIYEIKNQNTYIHLHGIWQGWHISVNRPTRLAICWANNNSGLDLKAREIQARSVDFLASYSKSTKDYSPEIKAKCHSDPLISLQCRIQTFLHSEVLNLCIRRSFFICIYKGNYRFDSRDTTNVYINHKNCCKTIPYRWSHMPKI
jgi:hypothetical protein